MGRRKKRVATADDEKNYQDLQDVIGTLASSDATQWFFSIRRRRPGIDSLWQYWKRNIAVDQMGDIREYCYKEGGDEWEYRIKVHDTAGKKPVTEDGNTLEERIIPALTAAKPDGPTLAAPPDDPDLQDRFNQIKRRRQELEIKRREMDLWRQEAQLEKIKKAIDDGDDDNDEDDAPHMPGFFHPQYGWIEASRLKHSRYPEYLPPYGMPRESESSSMAKMATEMAKAFSQMARPSEQSALRDVEILKLIMGNISGKSFEPKQILDMVSPLMSGMLTNFQSLNAETTKLLMGKLSDGDQMWKEKVIDLMQIGGKSEDEIDRWKRILGLVEDAGVGLTKIIFGRPAILKKGKGKAVSVPVIKKPDVPQLERGSPPPPKLEEEAQGVTPGRKGNPPSPAPPASSAKAVITQRVRAFLLAQEQEMEIRSDPAWVAEKLDELWASLPQILRAKLESLPLDKVYDTLREYDSEMVDRIMKSVATDESGEKKEWCVVFWQGMLHPEEDEDDEGKEDDKEGGDGGGEPSDPDPESEPGLEKKPPEVEHAASS